MNRTLRRPMFRIGGTAEGITSGLSRQGYQGTGNASDQRVNKLSDIRNMDIGQLKELAGTMAYKPRGTNVYDFMTQSWSEGTSFNDAAASHKVSNFII